jgi:hypothetical protein
MLTDKFPNVVYNSMLNINLIEFFQNSFGQFNDELFYQWFRGTYRLPWIVLRKFSASIMKPFNVHHHWNFI